MLRPCPGCHRHVAGETTCRFCGIALPPQEPPRAIISGRFSRAAVFAGATLAGCWTGGEPASTTVEHRDTPIRDRSPAHDARTQDPTVVHTRGTIEGVVTNRSTGAAIAGTPIDLRSRATGQTRTVVTDANGHYVFTDVEPGDYEIVSMRSNNPRRSPQTSSITVADGAALHRDLTVFVQPVSNIPMPYGAPPARRRFV